MCDAVKGGDSGIKTEDPSVTITFALEILADYAQLLRDGSIGGEGRYTLAAVEQVFDELEAMLGESDDERVAAFLDGRMDARRREKMLVHLNGSRGDRAVLAGTAAVLRRLEEADLAGGTN